MEAATVSIMYRYNVMALYCRGYGGMPVSDSVGARRTGRGSCIGMVFRGRLHFNEHGIVQCHVSIHVHRSRELERSQAARYKFNVNVVRADAMTLHVRLTMSECHCHVCHVVSLLVRLHVLSSCHAALNVDR